MSVVNPIKDRQILEKIKNHLREENTRNYLLFRIGVNLGLPLNELLYLRIEDIVGKKEFLSGGYRLRINDSLQKELAFYAGRRDSGYLFRARGNQPISRFQVYNVLKNAAEVAGFHETVGALTLRKTFAYWAHKEQRIYLPLLSKYLNHHTISHTLKYIGVEKMATEEVRLAEMNL